MVTQNNKNNNKINCTLAKLAQFILAIREQFSLTVKYSRSHIGLFMFFSLCYSHAHPLWATEKVSHWEVWLRPRSHIRGWHLDTGGKQLEEEKWEEWQINPQINNILSTHLSRSLTNTAWSNPFLSYYVFCHSSLSVVRGFIFLGSHSWVKSFDILIFTSCQQIHMTSIIDDPSSNLIQSFFSLL